MSDSTRSLQKLTSLGLTGAAVDASCPPQPRQDGSAYHAGEEALADSTEMSSAAGTNNADMVVEVSCDSTEQVPEPGSPPPPAKSAPGPSPEAPLDSGIRRYRTAFRPDQIKRLEAEFLKDNYVSRPKRNELATELGLAEGTIKVWFQNRRMKHKRQQMTAWPLDPRLADPALAAVLLQAAVASGAYPCWGGLAPPLPYCSPLAAAKCRLAPYAPLPVRPQPSAPFLLPPLDSSLAALPLGTPLLPSVSRHMERPQLDRTQLDRAQLDRQQLDSAQLERGTELDRAQLYRKAQLDRARLNRPQLDGAQLDRTVQLDGAQLERMPSRKEQLDRAQLDRAPLDRAQLERQFLQRERPQTLDRALLERRNLMAPSPEKLLEALPEQSEFFRPFESFVPKKDLE